MPRGSVFLAHAEIAERVEGTILIKRMQADPLIILRHRIVLSNATFTNDARHRLRLRHALLFHQKFESTIAPPARGYLEHPRLTPLGVDDGPNAEALQQGALRNSLGKLLDRNASLHAADVRLAEDELVEGNVA